MNVSISELKHKYTLVLHLTLYSFKWIADLAKLSNSKYCAVHQLTGGEAMLCSSFDEESSTTIIFMVYSIRRWDAVGIVVHDCVVCLHERGFCGCQCVCMSVCLCVTCPSVLQPDKQEDGTVTGKDRWRQKLLSAMAAGVPVTPPFLSFTSPPSSSHLLVPLPFTHLFLSLFPFLLLLLPPPHLPFPFPILQAAVYLFFSSCPILWLLQFQLVRYSFVQLSALFFFFF